MRDYIKMPDNRTFVTARQWREMFGRNNSALLPPAADDLADEKQPSPPSPLKGTSDVS